VQRIQLKKRSRNRSRTPSGERIESFVSSDDCGSVDPALSFARGVQLYVFIEDAPEAERIIAEARVESPEGESAADE